MCRIIEPAAHAAKVEPCFDLVRAAQELSHLCLVDLHQLESMRSTILQREIIALFSRWGNELIEHSLSPDRRIEPFERN